MVDLTGILKPVPDFGFGSPEERIEKAKRLSQQVADLARIEEARAEQARLKAGAPAPNRDAEFQFRKPRDVLRTNAPPPFYFDEVPRSLGDFAYHYSEATGSDPSGVIVSAVTAAASVIDDNFKLVVAPESEWVVSARQWSFLCGNASAGKSPSIRAATNPIKLMHRVLIERWSEEWSEAKPHERPAQPALFTSDATIAALSMKLQGNPRGLLMLTEEFSSWVGGIDSADKGEAAKNRGDWLQLRDGGPHQIDRIERGSIFVPNWGVSVLAACTPGGLAKQLKFMPEDGLIQRFIPCIMASAKLDARGDARNALTEWRQWLEWAYTFTTSALPRHHFLTPRARAMFDAEVRELRQLVQATEEFAPAYASHLGKHPGMLAEIALVFHIFGVPGGQNPTEAVGEEAMAYAIKYLRKARRHAHTLYSSILSSSPAFELAQALARSIVASDEPMATIGRDWMTQHCQMFKKTTDDRLRREAVQVLEDADWLMAQTHVRSYGGWPSKYSVHPEVFKIFAREGEQWRARRAAVRDAIGDGA